MGMIPSAILIFSLIGLFLYWNVSSTDIKRNFKRFLGSAKQIPLAGSNPMMQKEETHRFSLCQDVIYQIRNAQWIKRRDITPENETRQSLQEIEIRKRRTLPTILHRNDSRCGGKPFSHTSSRFDYQLAAICDVTSAAPCCNHEKKYCGNGPDFCACNHCTDYRREISAEMYQWTPLNGCVFTVFSSKDACKLMSEKIFRLVLVGDSLVRHLFNALMILLTNDAEQGSLRNDLNSMEKGNCKGFMQFVDAGPSACHTKTVTSISRKKNGSKFCGGNYSFDIFFTEAYSSYEAMDLLATVRRELNKEKVVIAIGEGLHDDLDPQIVQKEIMEPVLELKSKFGAKWPYILWLSTHATGSLKVSNYITPSYNDRIARFNDDMKNYLSHFGIPALDTFSMTKGVRSIDGIHFGVGVNMMKAQLLLNFIKETF